MQFTTLNVEDKEYKLRLSTQNTEELERALGKNPLQIFDCVQQDTMPSTNDMTTVLFYSLKKYQSKIKKEDVYNIIDDYIDCGYSYADLINVIMEVYKASGIIPKDKEAEQSKN